ncbi:MAG TPA: glycerol kinase GlpK [Burkholderiaceae bacterium]|nr:glycerol kinase GlpK [Burkholderiaceae bacterium]
MSFILALDQGTSSSRAIAYDADGRTLATVSKPFTQHYPQPGWVEHDPEDIWNSQYACAREAFDIATAAGHALTAIGITNQRETTLLWNRRTGQAIHPAIVWQDRRTAEWCERYRAQGYSELVTARTGLVIDPYFSASKIVWLMNAIPTARALAEQGDLAFGTVDSWLIYKFTNGASHVTDVTNASRTMLYDIHAQQWDRQLCDMFGVPMNCLPKVLPSSGHFGDTRLFGGGVPILGCAGDQQAALLGQGCTRAGQAKNTYGTGCFMLLHTGAQAHVSRHGLLTTVAAQIHNTCEYALEGAVFNAGSAVQWLRDGLGIIERSADVFELAQSVSDTGDVFLVPAFNGLGSPHWDAHARGLLIGLTRGTTRAHIARATLESIALQSAEVLQAMQSDARIALTELRVDGGAAANDLLMQMQADLLGVPVVRPYELEATAFGAAMLAARAAGLTAFGAATNRTVKVFEPALAQSVAQARMQRWQEAVQRARGWTSVQINAT